MSQYIVLPRLTVSNANAQPVWWMIGPPPVTAYLGFAQALARRLKLQSHQGIAIVHHDIQFLGETGAGFRDLHPHQYRAASFIDAKDYSSKNHHALSLQPTARCHLVVSLVIRIDDNAAFPTKDIRVFLRGARLAGGTIIDAPEPTLVDAECSPEHVPRKVPSGFSVISRQDLMVKHDGERDMLDVLLRLTRRSADHSENLAWLVPTALGYAEITARQQRSGVRGDFPHAYAEPLVGLVQYRSARKAGLHFWRYRYPQARVCVASTDHLQGES